MTHVELEATFPFNALSQNGLYYKSEVSDI